MKNPFVQGVLLIVAAAVIALGSNAFAGRTRKLVLPGWYPNALEVPAKAVETKLAPAPVVVTPAPVVLPPTETVVTTTTTAAPVVVPPPKTTTTAEKTVPAPPPPAPKAVNISRFTPHPDKAYVEIAGDDVAALHKAGVLFLDARRSSVYEEGHIAGARPFSVWESDIDEKVNKLFEERSDPTAQNKPIVIYCTGGACEDSHMLAQKLWGIQFNNVYVYKDGYPDWVSRGGAVTK